MLPKEIKMILMTFSILIIGVFLIYLIANQFFKGTSEEITFEPKRTETAEGKATDYPAPGFELPNLEGKAVKLSDYRDKNVILTFWTTWNPAAQDQIVVLESYYQEIKDKTDISLFAVDNQEDKSVVSNFIRRGGYILPVLLDESGKAGESYKINTLPATYFINQAGKVEEIYIGVLSKEEIISKVEHLYQK